jgi:signal transduction histidine kinase
MLTDKKYISIPFNEKKLRERNRPLSILRSMSDFLAMSMDSREFLDSLLVKVLKDFDLEAGRIYLMEADGRHLVLAAHSGIETAGLERMGLDEGFSGKAARTKSFIAQHVSDLENEQRTALLKKRGFKIVICVPMIVMGKVAGVLNLATGLPFELDHNKIDLLNVLGSEIAAAIENARLYKDLQEKIRQLKEQKELSKFFAYSIAHDLKSPAIGIYGFSRRLKERCADDADEKRKRYCLEIMKLAEHMTTLLEEMNGFIASKETQPHFERIQLKDITRTIRSEFAARLRSHNAELSETDSNPEMVADRMSLLRVFRNFVDNALKYGGSNLRSISINYSEDEAFHILSVVDDGIGIAPEEKHSVFDPFQRNHAAQGTTGSGLGLAIVREVAKKHGGRAWVESGNNQGAVFYISIAKDLNTTTL